MDKFDKVNSYHLSAIGLLGGTFDPIHNAHIEIASIAQEKFHLDMVYFIVAKDPPVKDHVVLDAEKRFDLVLKALEPYEFLQASRLELDRPGKSYSYLTVEDYKKQFPDVELFWIMGEDAFAGLSEWKNYDYLEKNLSFIVFSRAGSRKPEAEGLSDLRTHHMLNFNLDLSSTLLRKGIREFRLEPGVPDKIREKVSEYYRKD